MTVDMEHVRIIEIKIKAIFCATDLSAKGNFTHFMIVFIKVSILPPLRALQIIIKLAFLKIGRYA
jgi:hypothetical protein